jgi:hypothetical protein
MRGIVQSVIGVGGGPQGVELEAAPIAQVGEPQRTTEDKRLRSLPEDLT